MTLGSYRGHTAMNAVNNRTLYVVYFNHGSTISPLTAFKRVESFF